MTTNNRTPSILNPLDTFDGTIFLHNLSVMIENMLSDLETSINSKDLSFQSECLLLGVQPKVYQPLMKRVTCESLEDKIKHYENKKKRKQRSN